MHFTRSPLLSAVALLVGTNLASAAVAWNEGSNGDLSNDRLNPTVLTFNLGMNSVIGTTLSGDREYFTFTLPAGFTLTSIVASSFTGGDGTAFIGVQGGTTMTVDPNSGSPTGLLGYTHFGPGPGNVGLNLLPAMGTGPGSTGFTPPLGAGSYTFWVQQAGPSATTFQLEFTAVPEPGEIAAIMGAMALAGAVWRRRRPASLELRA